MIDFTPSAEQLAWQKKAKEFAEKEVKPITLMLDQLPVEEFYWPIAKKIVEYGLAWFEIPEKWSGVKSHVDTPTKALILEELGVGDAGVALTSQRLWYMPALGLKKEVAEKLMDGWCDREKPRFWANTITEPAAGSDVASMITSARQDGDDWIINGNKHFISEGASASLFRVRATIDKNLRAEGIRTFIIPAGTPGLSVGKIEHKMGCRVSRVAEIHFDNVRIHKDYMLQEGTFAEMSRGLARGRIINCGGIGTGIARCSYETAVAHFQGTPERYKTALNNELISFTLAEMAATILACRLMVWRAAWDWEHNPPGLNESALCRTFCSDAIMKVANSALQLVGLYGYGQNFILEKCFRDAKLMSIYEGTTEINELIVARHIFPRRD